MFLKSLLKSLKLLVSAAAATLAMGFAHATTTIVDIAASNSQFSTLSKALAAAGLTETLKGPGPYTVFAPTDAAFAKLPPGTLEGLMADPAKLRSILTYHVVAGTVKAADVKSGATKTANGQSVNIMAEGGRVMVGTARVIATDVIASNGVIHAIDSVIIPN
jgi:uncharacterized surface protein with fasciclin (FAS1) repeats